MIKKLIMAGFCLSLFGSCYYDNKEDLYQNFNDTNCNTDSVTYSTNISSIIGTNCAVSGCHVGPNAQNNLDLSLYAEVKSIADNNQLVGRITGTSGALMPPGGALPNCDIEKIKAWVSNGAPNN